MTATGNKPSIRMDEEEIWEFVNSAHTGILTTLKMDGSPVTLPLWFACIDRTIYFSTRGKKLNRIRNNPASCFLVEDGERWAELRAVQFSGRSELITPDDELQSAFNAESARKYDAYRPKMKNIPTSSQKAYGVMQLVRFTPEGRALNWNNSYLGLP